jgi:hypothetical protein
MGWHVEMHEVYSSVRGEGEERLLCAAPRIGATSFDQALAMAARV